MKPIKQLFNTLGKEILLLVAVSLVTAFTVNHFSPVGIALVGRWDTSRGAVSALAKDEPQYDGFEIEAPDLAKVLFDRGEALFVDARSADTFAEGHIQGAFSLPAGEFETRLYQFSSAYEPDRPMVVYCSGRECRDSHKVAKLLIELGYHKVQVFIDGYPAWVAKGYPVEK